MCIYEDQIGKFDWRQTYVGRIKFAQFDTVSTAKKIIVATEENVLAALNLKTGQVVWRHVFESASAGNIQLLHVGEKVTTVTGSNPYLVRGWDTATGILLWEWSLTLQDDTISEYSEWWVQNNMLVHMLPVFGSHVEVTMYNLLTGNNRGATSKLPAIWTNEGCVLSAPYYICVSGEAGSRLLLSIDVTSDAVKILSRPLADYISNEKTFGGYLKALSGNSVVPGFTVDDKVVLLIKGDNYQKANVELAKQGSSATVIDGANENILVQAYTDQVKGFTLSAHTISTGKEVPEIHCIDPSMKIPEPELVEVMCTRTAKEQHACRLLVNGADDAVHLMQQGGRVLWTREEALANVVAVEFVDLPVSETEAALESEFDQKEGSVWSAFSRRLHTQYQQLLNLIKSFQGEDAVQETSSLVRDYFNLHKIIVLVTDAGKIFGMDNLSGDILWHIYDPDLNPENAVIFTRRSARHAPFDAYVSIVAKHEETGNGYVVSLNPIRGSRAGAALRLDARLLQAAALPRADAEHLHALVLLDEDENVQVLPFSAESLVENFYMYVADKETGHVQGYALKYNGKEVVAQRTWSARLGGGVVATAARSRHERVRAPGRALPDRSVLYKYSNPNLVLFVLEKEDPTHKGWRSTTHRSVRYRVDSDRRGEVVTAVVLDAATGAPAAAAWHRRARALPLAVHADNCFAYLYRNEKHRRVELATIELYEGAERWLEAGAPFSSQAEARAPAVQRRAHILPATPLAAALTATRRSLADRHLLLALTRGAIVEVPWAYLETPAPELPLPPDATLNYNRSVARARRAAAAPAGLESTSLVLVTGLDLFYTRVAPSKTFDLLKDDFDYYLITLVLGALVVATYSSKYFASRKMLKMAWK
ncbi:unnamed protein product, partial [Brenthis ino]